ncbi:hypothetical protein Hanom_Chr13g01230571 [Helianthus anomalus]
MALGVAPFDCVPNGSGLFSGPNEELQTFRSAKPDPHKSLCCLHTEIRHPVSSKL